MLAGAMIVVRDILEAPKDDEAVIIEASSELEDIDDGMNFVVDENTIAYTPPLPRHRSQRAREHKSDRRPSMKAIVKLVAWLAASVGAVSVVFVAGMRSKSPTVLNAVRRISKATSLMC